MNRRSVSRPDSPTLRERIRSTTAEAILTAAEEVFADQGLHAAHMGEIASRAGVSVGTLYNHFEDREALLAGLLEARRAELLSRLDDVLEEADDLPVTGRLRALLGAMLAHKRQHRKFLQILLQGEIGRYEQTFPSACRMPAATMREIVSRLEKVTRQGVRDGTLRPGVASLAPVVLMGMVRALAIRDALGGVETEAADQAEQLLDFFLKGAGA